ncbi:MAG: flagellar basal body P-ring formation protein FlgA, partial [Acidobacteria bacterium]|nr:flagellar basal body P-ring formation protein FlgA [Acidobacteriota bacterium]
GELDFDLRHLGVPARTDRLSPVLWRGDVLYGGNRRFSIWARVSIAVKSVRLVAATTLKPAEAISAAQVRLETIETFPVAGRMASVDQVVGMIPRRLLPAGSELRRADLIGPKDISAGDSVEVEVRAGNTRLAFTGTAVTAGCVGDSISVRNPGTKKLFQAHVTGKGTALVQANGSRVY